MFPHKILGISAVALAALSMDQINRAIGQTPALPDHPPALSPDEELKRLKPAEGLEIKLVAAEPDAAQPLSISFDNRGRMWVLQYRQYPNPAALKPVAVDQYLRTRYDRLPDPPPTGPKGEDRISIFEDKNGDGRAETAKIFISDLNLASGMALGYGGVFVVQPPYLLFYPDRDGDDVPDGPPRVLLTGFGMEDAHAFANSLTWGPDGWLYGAQGSTVTANVRGIGFQQGIWRYHFRTDRFELFSEGGGNTWSVEFDRYGNLFPAGNTVEPLEHHVQGAYLVKGFGKHGPLHNPHTFGYFQPVVHYGYLGDSLSGGAIVYQGGAFPPAFNNACICPHTRHSACRWATIESRGSTFATRAAGDFVTSEDVWFRPIDMTTGPDGAVYIADWYDYNISHSSPKNRSEWYQPSRLDGRIWRVAPPGCAPLPAGSFDLSRRSSAELVDLLAHPNDWYARQARQLLAERSDSSVVPTLTEWALTSKDQRLALQGLWSIHVLGALDSALALKTLSSPHEYVRAWTIRLLGDDRNIPPRLRNEFTSLAKSDPSVIVRCQLAGTAKRLPSAAAMPILEQLIRHDEDLNDVQMPLLIWWGLEDKAITDIALILQMLDSDELWQRPLLRNFLLERLARRYVAEGSNAAFTACAKLLGRAMQHHLVEPALTGMLQALSGRQSERIQGELSNRILSLTQAEPGNSRVLELALRVGVPGSVEAAIQAVQRETTPAADRIALIQALGETRTSSAVDVLIGLLQDTTPDSLRPSIIASLGYFSDDSIADAILASLPRWKSELRAKAIDLLCTRVAWSQKLIEAIEKKILPAAMVSVDQVRRMRQSTDERGLKRMESLWGKIQSATAFEIQGRIEAVSQLLARASGDALRGRAHFAKLCASCHQLHHQGTVFGPDLASVNRKDREWLVRNIIDPSEIIRPEFVPFTVETKDGRSLTGLLAENKPDLVVLVDAKNQRTPLGRSEIDRMEESGTSMMPEKLLDDLTEQEIRDLFAFLQSEIEPGPNLNGKKVAP